jgi:hypothetical protein
MARRPLTFKQRDLTAALKAARAAGCEVASITVDGDGKIKVQLVTSRRQAGEKPCCGNEWDAVLE